MTVTRKQPKPTGKTDLVSAPRAITYSNFSRIEGVLLRLEECHCALDLMNDGAGVGVSCPKDIGRAIQCIADILRVQTDDLQTTFDCLFSITKGDATAQ